MPSHHSSVTCSILLVSRTVSYIVSVPSCVVGRYSRIDVDVSAPIVPFRETIVPPPTTDRVNELIDPDAGASGNRPAPPPADSVGRESSSDGSQCRQHTVAVSTVDRHCSVHLRAVPLPSGVVHCLVQYSHLVRTANKLSSAATPTDRADLLAGVSEQLAADLRAFRLRLEAEFAGAGDDEAWSAAVDRVWSFSRNGTNVLLNYVEGYDRPSPWTGLDRGPCRDSPSDGVPDQTSPSDDGLGRSVGVGGGGGLWEYDSAVVSGFQIATQSGPLCEEPMMGVGFVVEQWIINSEPAQSTDSGMPAAADSEVRIDNISYTLPPLNARPVFTT